MSSELEARPDRTPILRRAVAGLVLVGAVAIGIYIIIGIVKAILWTVIGIAVVIAILWAIKTLVW
jgi:hypothetical protein